MDPLRPPDDPDLDNPYAPPRATFVPESTLPLQFAGIPFSVGDIFNWTWTVYKERTWPCLFIFWGAFGMEWAISFAVQMLLPVLMLAIKDPTFFMIINVLIFFVSWVTQVWLSIGMTRGFLKIGRGEPVTFDVLFSGGRYLVNTILGAIIVGLIIGGLALIPAFVLGALFVAVRNQASAGTLVFVFGCASFAVLLIYMIARLLQFFYLVVDRNAGPMDSIQLSWQLTRHRAGTIVVILLLGFVLTLAGVLALCVGLIFTLPLNSLLQVVTYLALSEQDL
jgi:uncharacterized membrane protein